MPYVVRVENGKIDKKSAYYTRRLQKKNTKEADRRLRQILNENYTDNELKVEISYESCLPRTVASYTNQIKHITEARKKSLPKFKEVRTVSWDEIKTLCIKKGWYTRGTSEQYSNLARFVYDMEEATTEDLVYIASDILEHSDTEYDIEEILWELNRVCNTSFKHE